MRTKAIVVALALMVIAITSGCPAGHQEGGETVSDEDRAAAESLFRQVQDADYTSFARAPGWETPHTSGTTIHHGRFLDIYLNDVIAGATGAGAPWPVGSIIVKDGWDDAAGTVRTATAILRKDADGVWFGAEFDAAGAVVNAGKNAEECTSCHSSAPDYTLAF